MSDPASPSARYHRNTVRLTSANTAIAAGIDGDGQAPVAEEMGKPRVVQLPFPSGESTQRSVGRGFRDEKTQAPVAARLNAQRAVELYRRGQQRGGGYGFAENSAHHRGIVVAAGELPPRLVQIDQLTAHVAALDNEPVKTVAIRLHVRDL